ncbi:DUF2076 domain-containing protein [Crenalkalicoccus roseus]|uniref:DUF2076 domain-containing protein n=1 Tax=Crenalkalicoccus roseus TaxID=1485588 RepID=UPI00107FD8F3|nr:DUF2076 domain-containing protein [Crenalkalicoccus roseus]
MTDEERRIITEFVQRVAGASAPARAAGPWGGSVPSTQARPPLPPVDPEADALIADLFSRYPEARYRLTQTAFVQEHALTQAQNRIQELEWELENARRQAQAAQGRGGLLGGMFGGGAGRAAPMPPRPQPLPPPGGVNPAAMQPGRSGPGFLATAAMTAAGVAGGMVLGNMLMNAFSGGGMAQAAGMDAGAFGQEAVPASSPWTDPGAAAAEPGFQPAGGQDAWGGYEDEGGAGYDDAGGFDEEI